MQTQLDTTNPYGYDRYGFAWQQVPRQSGLHLDIGCGDGRFLRSLQAKGIQCLVGVDISWEAVRQAYRASGGLEIIHLAQTMPLPFPDKLFSSITLMDVIEHVADQKMLLDEVHRVLLDDGTLIVTVPGRHLFSVFDLGNMKFRFPRLHRWYYCRTHSLADYERRYGANPDGLVGDVSAAKRWHEHFRAGQLADLLSESGFDVTMTDGAGFFTRVLKMADWLIGRWGWFHAGIRMAMRWDARCFGSANLFCIAQKSVTSSLKQTEITLDDHDGVSDDLETADLQHVL